jgi:glycosyltransferase involved in cell wall biosynthesis
MSSLPRIAFLGGQYLLDETIGVNGTQVQLYMLSAGLAKRGHDVHYLAATRGDDRPSEGPHGIRLHWLSPAGLLFGWAADIRAVWKELDAIKPAVIYQRGRSNWTYAGAAWAKRNGAHFVWASNGEDSCDFWRSIKRVWRSPRPFWRKSVLSVLYVIPDMLIHRGVRQSTVVINQTIHQRCQLYRNYGKEGAILPSYFPKPVATASEIKENVVLWLGNAGPGKRPHLFVDLAKECSDLTGWRFILAGPIHQSPYGEALTKSAAGVANLEIVGAVPFDQSDEWYRRASLFVNTSGPTSEGMPNAFIQAWHAGTPVMSLHHNPNFWITDHELGHWAHDDFDMLVRKTKDMMMDPQRVERDAAHCRSFAGKMFDGDGIIEHYGGVFSG